MKVALLEFFVTEGKILAFVIDPQKPYSTSQPRLATIPIAEQQILALKSMIWSFGKASAIVARNLVLFQEIGKAILTPILEYLGTCEILYIVPHKALHYLPLHAVEINGKALCDHFAVVYLPSASLLHFCQLNNVLRKAQRGFQRRILTVGVGAKEDSPYIRKKFIRETEIVTQSFESATNISLTGVRATKKAFYENSAECDLIHIASHGFFDSVTPLGCGPLLAFGKRLPTLMTKTNNHQHILKAEEFFQFRFKANLVVFSGCFTGMSEVRPGDELLGLARGLFVSGVPSIVLCLWQAHHGATMLFIKSFYEQLCSGKSKALAFQTAQRHLRQHLRFQHLKYWAPFVLLGDWL